MLNFVTQFASFVRLGLSICLNVYVTVWDDWIDVEFQNLSLLAWKETDAH